MGANTKRKRGAPPLEITPEVKSTVENIIDRYRSERKPAGLLSYNALVIYAAELYEEKECDVLLREHFWKKGYGREVIDAKNKVISTIIPDSTHSDRNVVVDTADAIEKFFTGKSTDKKKLLLSLKRNEVNLLRLHRHNTELEKRLERKEEQIAQLKEKNNALTESIAKMEAMFFAWLDASSNNKTPLIDLITTGDERLNKRTSVVDEFFRTAFSEPAAGYQKLYDYQTSKTTNVVDFKNRKENEKEEEKPKKKTLADQFDWSDLE